jgi:hypothetical protein
MSKIYDLNTNFLRRETGNAILLAKQCVEARTPVEAASMMADAGAASCRKAQSLPDDWVSCFGITVKLNHSMQQRMVDVNKDAAACTAPAIIA